MTYARGRAASTSAASRRPARSASRCAPATVDGRGRTTDARARGRSLEVRARVRAGATRRRRGRRFGATRRRRRSRTASSPDTLARRARRRRGRSSPRRACCSQAWTAAAIYRATPRRPSRSPASSARSRWPARPSGRPPPDRRRALGLLARLLGARDAAPRRRGRASSRGRRPRRTPDALADLVTQVEREVNGAMTSIPLADAARASPRRAPHARSSASRSPPRSLGLVVADGARLASPAHADDRHAAGALVGDRRARRLGEHLRRHVLAHRRDALVARAERRPLRPRRLLRPGVRGAAAGDARGRPPAARPLLHAAAARRARLRADVSAEPVGAQRSARARRSRPGSSSRTGSRSRTGCSKPVAILVSDLDDDPADLPRLVTIMLALKRDHIPLRIVGLNPVEPGHRPLQAAERRRADRARGDARSRARSRSNHTPFPWTLVALALVVAVGARRARALGTAARVEERAVKTALGFVGAAVLARARRARGAPRRRRSRLAEDAARATTRCSPSIARGGDLAAGRRTSARSRSERSACATTSTRGVRSRSTSRP